MDHSANLCYSSAGNLVMGPWECLPMPIAPESYITNNAFVMTISSARFSNVYHLQNSSGGGK
jgi:hypothetical protein